MESCEARLTFRIIGGIIHEHADAPHPLFLLREHRQRRASFDHLVGELLEM